MNGPCSHVQKGPCPHRPKASESPIPLFPGIRLTLLCLPSGALSLSSGAEAPFIGLLHCRAGKGVWNEGGARRATVAPGGLLAVLCAKDSLPVSVCPGDCFEGFLLTVSPEILNTDPPEFLKGTGITGDFLCHKFFSDGRFLLLSEDEQTDAVCSAFYGQPEPLQNAYWRLKAQELLLRLSTLDSPLCGPSHPYQAEQIRIVRQIHDQLVHNLDKRITIEDLSRKYLMNPTTLKSMFKAIYGTSLAAHVKEHRMEKAAELLLSSSGSVAQIARAVGYENQSKFTTAFKEFYQVLPTEYRRRHGEIQ